MTPQSQGAVVKKPTAKPLRTRVDPRAATALRLQSARLSRQKGATNRSRKRR